MVDRGIYNPSMYWSYPEILVNDGRYGDTLMVYRNHQPITVDGNDFYCQGTKLSQKEMEEFQTKENLKSTHDQDHYTAR